MIANMLLQEMLLSVTVKFAKSPWLTGRYVECGAAHMCPEWRPG